MKFQNKHSSTDFMAEFIFIGPINYMIRLPQEKTSHTTCMNGQDKQFCIYSTLRQWTRVNDVLRSSTG